MTARVRGIIKARNEAHVIADTLDAWAPYCTDGIHVYDDHSLDETADICRSHPAVVEVVTSDLIDPDRERAEWYNRQVILASAQRFLGPMDWVVYFDADEQPEIFDNRILEDPSVGCVALMSFDVYVTEEDAHLPTADYRQRRYCTPAFQVQPYFYRNNQDLVFQLPDQRNLTSTWTQQGEYVLTGMLRHFGTGISVEHWDNKCQYYGEVFGPRYAEKWNSRRGKAVHTHDSFGVELVLWDDLRTGKVKPDFSRAEGRELVA